MDQGHVYGVPFHNSTPLLYYSVDAFKAAGLDPDHPPATWQEWADAALDASYGNAMEKLTLGAFVRPLLDLVAFARFEAGAEAYKVA